MTEQDYFDEQSKVVINELMRLKGYTREKAVRMWMTSNTKKIIQDERGRSFVSGARCYDELLLEFSNNSHWLRNEFV